MKRNLTKLLSVGLLCLSFYAFGQQKPITGKVVDSNNYPVQDAYVYVEGTDNGVYTDGEGFYTIEAKKGDIIKVEFIGFDTKNIKVNDGNKYNVKLSKGNEGIKLDKLVVIGYGSQSQKDLTGAVTSVNVDDLKNQSVASVEQALQGKSPGLQIVSSNGRAGNQTQMSIRGNGSLRASNDVLYVIDGVPQESMGSLTNEDIKSISVLKDAASAAIYGSRASNGVILIETKRGGFGEKTKISFNMSSGWQMPVNLPNLLDAKGYKFIHDVARRNYEKDIASGALKSPKDPATLTPMTSSKTNTDWLSLVLNDPALVERYQVSVSGGGETTRAYLSGSYFHQEGIIKQNDYKKARIRLNVEQKLSRKLSVGVRSYFSYSQNFPFADDNSRYQPWGAAVEASPIEPIYKNGELNDDVKNPLFAFQRSIVDRWQTIGGQVYLDFEPVTGLKWHSSYSGNIDNLRHNRYDPPSSKQGKNGDNEPTGYGRYEMKNNRSYQLENTLIYEKRFFDGGLKLNALLGHTYQRWDYEDAYLEGEKFPSDDLGWLVSAGEINKGRSYIAQMGIESIFARLQLNWKDRYLLMFSARRDGSTKFSKGNQWGNFPAASFSWIISDEDFFQSKVIDLLKIRTSYGLTGNQSGIAYSVGQNLITGGQNYDQSPGLSALTVFNPNLKWETGYSSNIGLDLGFFNRLNLNIDFYSKKTKGLLASISIPQESGYRTMLANAGEISNKGFEINTSIDILKNRELKWNLAANFSYNKNEILNIGREEGYYTTGFASVVMEGKELGSFYLIESLGIAQKPYEYKNSKGEVTKVIQPGDIIYKDQNGDGKINGDDRVVYGGAIAPIYGGVSTSLSYKGFDLSIAGQYSLGKKVYAMYKERLLNGGATGYPSFSENMLGSALNYWSITNRDAENPRPHLSSEISKWNNQRSTRFLESADYFRISDITLGFDLKSIKSLNLSFIDGARVYVQAKNMFTFTGYSGVDPETQYIDQEEYGNQNRSDASKITSGIDLNGIPNVKSINVGLNLKF